MFSVESVGLGVLSSMLILGAGASVPLQAAEAKLADPTRPLNFQAATRKASSYQLSSIFISDQRARAIINGQLVGVNDRVGQAKVLEIKSGEVVLHTPEGNQHLRLHKTIKRVHSEQ